MTLEEAQEVRQSHVWQLVKDELSKRIAVLQQELMTIPPDQLVRVQAKLRTLMEVQRLPDDMIEREQP